MRESYDGSRRTTSARGLVAMRANPLETNPEREARIRERAYRLWIADGRPEGQADIYWLNAQRELLTASIEGSATEAAKPAKKPKLARFRKGKTKAA